MYLYLHEIDNRDRLLSDRERRNAQHQEDMDEREQTSREVYRRHKEHLAERVDSYVRRTERKKPRRERKKE